MTTINCALIKNNHVVDVIVFLSQDDVLAQTIVSEKNYDSYVWSEQVVERYSSYDNGVFTPPTYEYLVSVGVLDRVPEPIVPSE